MMSVFCIIIIIIITTTTTVVFAHGSSDIAYMYYIVTVVSCTCTFKILAEIYINVTLHSVVRVLRFEAPASVAD